MATTSIGSALWPQTMCGRVICLVSEKVYGRRGSTTGPMLCQDERTDCALLDPETKRAFERAWREFTGADGD